MATNPVSAHSSSVLSKREKRERVHTPHQRPHAGDQVDYFCLHALRVWAGAELRVEGRWGEVDCLTVDIGVLAWCPVAYGVLQVDGRR